MPQAGWIRFRPTYSSRRRPSVELYDYRADPEQLENLAAGKSAVTAKLLAVLRKWQAETGDTTPDSLTPDWRSRETARKLPAFGERREMPGKAAGAALITAPGPF